MDDFTDVENSMLLNQRILAKGTPPGGDPPKEMIIGLASFTETFGSRIARFF